MGFLIQGLESVLTGDRKISQISQNLNLLRLSLIVTQSVDRQTEKEVEMKGEDDSSLAKGDMGNGEGEEGRGNARHQI